MAKKKEPKKSHPAVKFKYYFPEDYRPVYNNAVWGGMNVKGELDIHFLYDRNPLPLSSTHEIKDGIILGTPKSRETGKSTLRFVQTGVVMNRESAMSLYNWLGEKIKMFTELTNDKKRVKNA